MAYTSGCLALYCCVVKDIVVASVMKSLCNTSWSLFPWPPPVFHMASLKASNDHAAKWHTYATNLLQILSRSIGPDTIQPAIGSTINASLRAVIEAMMLSCVSFNWCQLSLRNSTHMCIYMDMERLTVQCMHMYIHMYTTAVWTCVCVETAIYLYGCIHTYTRTQ